MQNLFYLVLVENGEPTWDIRHWVTTSYASSIGVLAVQMHMAHIFGSIFFTVLGPSILKFLRFKGLIFKLTISYY